MFLLIAGARTHAKVTPTGMEDTRQADEDTPVKQTECCAMFLHSWVKLNTVN